MSNEKKFIEVQIGNIILCFIVLSPIIDVINSLMNRYWGVTTGIGIMSRGILILLIFSYLLSNIRKVFRGGVLNYLIVGMLFLTSINFIVNWYQKEPFSLMSEATFIFKTVYFFMVVLFMLIWLNSKERKIAVLKFTTISSIIYNLFIWGPHFLGVSFDAYEYMKEGSVGWFYAANEISSLIAILLPFVFFYYLHSQKNEENVPKKYRVLSIIALITFMPSFYVIGTKVSLGAGLLYSLFLAVYFAVNSTKNKKNILLSLVFVIEIFVLITSPSVSNTKTHLEQTDKEPIEVVVKEEEEMKKGEIDYPEPIHPLLTKVLSSRDIYLSLHYGYYDEASLERKILGLGYSSEYDIKPKMIEMDFFDLVFSYGILFTILFMIFVCILGKRIIETIVNERDRLVKTMIFLSVTIVCGISFLTGHILFAPAVSFFWAMSIVYITSLRDGSR